MIACIHIVSDYSWHRGNKVSGMLKFNMSDPSLPKSDIGGHRHEIFVGKSRQCWWDWWAIQCLWCIPIYVTFINWAINPQNLPETPTCIYTLLSRSILQNNPLNNRTVGRYCGGETWPITISRWWSKMVELGRLLCTGHGWL